MTVLLLKTLHCLLERVPQSPWCIICVWATVPTFYCIVLILWCASVIGWIRIKWHLTESVVELITLICTAVKIDKSLTVRLTFSWLILSLILILQILLLLQSLHCLACGIFDKKNLLIQHVYEILKFICCLRPNDKYKQESCTVTEMTAWCAFVVQYWYRYDPAT